MPVGQILPSETTVFEDRVSGATVRRLTHNRCHSHHLYFTNPGWFDGGRRLLIASHRVGAFNLCTVELAMRQGAAQKDAERSANLYGIELATGELTQITDFAAGVNALNAYINPTRDEVYCWQGRQMLAIDLHTGQWRPIYRVPDAWQSGNLSVTADGRYICALIFKQSDFDATPAVMHRDYHNFRERMEAKPPSRIVRIPVDGSESTVVWDERCFLGHVNTSPTLPDWLTFCHEGPWELVDHRMWALNHVTGEVIQLRQREQPGERIGHEYWHADGEHIGYHGSRPDGSHIFGRVRYDDTNRLEVSFPHSPQHIHSNDLSHIVADGGNTVKLWQWNGSGFDGPRVLCEHWCTPFIQICHVHPRFSPDGRQVLFTSNTGGYGNVYLADVPDFETLPRLEDVAGAK